MTQIFVKQSSTYAIIVNLDTDTTETLKQQVTDLTGMPEKSYRLVYCGRNLDPNKTLKESKLKKESTVHMVMRVLSCAHCHYQEEQCK